jgi:hypothetical protein
MKKGCGKDTEKFLNYEEKNARESVTQSNSCLDGNKNAASTI